MPKIKSAKKALRQSIRRRKRNLAKTKIIRQTIIQYKKLLAAADTEKAREAIPGLYKILDKAAKTKLFKKNKTRRLKSRLSSKLSQLSAKSTKTSA